MRKANEDKLDEINRINALKNNLIKWWNVHLEHCGSKIGSVEGYIIEEDELKVFSEDNTNLYLDILKDNHRLEDVYDLAMQDLKEQEEEEAAKLLEEANAIYERLMREAQMDEEAKLMEIEEARRLAENG